MKCFCGGDGKYTDWNCGGSFLRECPHCNGTGTKQCACTEVRVKCGGHMGQEIINEPREVEEHNPWID